MIYRAVFIASWQPAVSDGYKRFRIVHQDKVIPGLFGWFTQSANCGSLTIPNSYVEISLGPVVAVVDALLEMPSEISKIRNAGWSESFTDQEQRLILSKWVKQGFRNGLYLSRGRTLFAVPLKDVLKPDMKRLKRPSSTRVLVRASTAAKERALVERLCS